MDRWELFAPLGRQFASTGLGSVMRAAGLGLFFAPVIAGAEVPRVVTDIAPVQSLVAQVMGDLGAPIPLMDQGADAHHFALRPSQARALQQAELVVWIGPEMTPWLSGALASGDASRRVLGLLAAEGTARQDFAAEHRHDAEEDHSGHDHAAHDHDHAAHDHDHDHDDAGHDHADHSDTPSAEGGAAVQDDHHGHSHSGVDPHAWLNPANAIAWLDLIAEELAALDAENAATYRANAKAAGHALTALDAEIAASLAPHTDKPFVVAHDAYGYFTHHYGLHLAGAVAGGDASAPGAARLRALRAGLAAEGVVCAFPEAGREAGLVEIVLEGSAIRLGPPLDPEGREITPGAGLYPELLQRLAKGLTDCLGAAD